MKKPKQIEMNFGKEKPRHHLLTTDRIRRFWQQVQKSDECWEWIGCKDTLGYGMISIFPYAKSICAHRFSYLIEHGHLPNICRHTCDNRGCVNPAHLRNGTHKDNSRDRSVRGRAPCKLTPADVRAIRKDDRSLSKIGKEYGVSLATIWSVKNGKTWRHVK